MFFLIQRKCQERYIEGGSVIVEVSLTCNRGCVELQTAIPEPPLLSESDNALTENIYIHAVYNFKS